MSSNYRDLDNFLNDSDSTIVVMLEPGVRVKLRDGSRPNDVGYYDGGEYGYELEVPAGARIEIVSLAG